MVEVICLCGRVWGHQHCAAVNGLCPLLKGRGWGLKWCPAESSTSTTVLCTTKPYREIHERVPQTNGTIVTITGIFTSQHLNSCCIFIFTKSHVEKGVGVDGSLIRGWGFIWWAKLRVFICCIWGRGLLKVKSPTLSIIRQV